MKFVIKDSSKNVTLTFPITPSELSVDSGTKTVSYDYAMIGSRELPRGTNPLKITFAGALPSDKVEMPTVDNRSADSVINRIKAWQKIDRKRLTLIITGTPWNLDVFIDDLSIDYKGNLITYSIRLVEYKEMVVKKVKAKPKPKPKPKVVKTPANTYKVTKNIGGYYTSLDAKARRSKRTTVKAGTYHVFNRANGMVNVTKKKGVAGSWINPADMKSKPKPAPKRTTKSPATYKVKKNMAGYYTSLDAKARRKRLATVRPGTYYVFNRANGMVNVTKKQKVPGSWINPK